ncbi:DotI/IcmL family type IV secretion protein [bacterium]|nr:DotI/IcmL family type IV secretion protein [bacterium]
MKKILITVAIYALTNAALYADTSPATAPAASTQPTINCQYHIPKATQAIELQLVSTWAEKAAMQSFDLSHNTIDAQLATLKPCYTDLGWKGFNDALQQSGNINAIKSQQLSASSQVNGKSQITAMKDNQWKVTLPMQVVYQNNKERLTQNLMINLIIGRKGSGDLGIMQLIAAPQQTAQVKPAM